jgi:hypothetical protein
MFILQTELGEEGEHANKITGNPGCTASQKGSPLARKVSRCTFLTLICMGVGPERPTCFEKLLS